MHSVEMTPIEIATQNDSNMDYFDAWGAEDADTLYTVLKHHLMDNNNINEIKIKCINALHPQSGRSLIHLACYRGHLERMYKLFVLIMGSTALQPSPVNITFTVTQLLCQTHCDLNINTRERHNDITPIMYAAREGHDHIIEYLVLTTDQTEVPKCLQELDLNAQDRDGYTALHYACINKHVHTVQVLSSQRECNVNLRDSQQRTPLHRAVECLQFALVKVLLDRKDIDINVQNHHGWTPLHYASYNQMQRTCSLLIDRGANVELKDSQGKKPLFYGYGFWEEEGGCSCPKHKK